MLKALYSKLSRLISVSIYGAEKEGSYKRFRAMLYGFMCIILYIPLFWTTGLHLYEYHKLLQQEEREQLYTNAQGAKKILETFMEDLSSSTRFVSEEYSYEELLDQNTASELLVRLKKMYGGIVDLGVIDTNGVYSRRSRPPIPRDLGHSFHFIPAIDSI